MRATLAGSAVIAALAWLGCGSEDGAPAAPLPSAGVPFNSFGTFLMIEPSLDELLP